MQFHKKPMGSKLDSSFMVRVPEDIKNLLVGRAKREGRPVASVCRDLVTEGITDHYSETQIAQERFEELQSEHKAMMVQFHNLAEKLELTHQMSSAVLAYVASRELSLRSGTKEEILEQTKRAVNIGVALGSQVSERHQLGQLGKV